MRKTFRSFQAAILLAAIGLATPAFSGVVYEVEVKDNLFVVINHEEQYSIFPADRPTPNGWKRTGKTCKPDACLKHIESVWTDMRPKAVHKFVQKQLSQHLKQQ